MDFEGLGTRLFLREVLEKPRFKLYRASCLDILVELPENSVDMIFADPPHLLSNGEILGG